MRQEELFDFFNTILFSYDYIFENNDEERKKLIDLINNLRKLEKRILFITSSDTSSRREIVEELLSFKIYADLNEVICINYLLAKYLSKLLNDGKVFIIASKGLSEELATAGIQNFGSGEEILEPDLPTYLQAFANESFSFDAVVIGFDEHISYPKLVRATTYLNNSRTIFLATSSKHPINAFTTCIECSTGRKALIFEDSDDLKKILCDSYNIMPEETLYIGNREGSDIRFGKRCAFKTLLISSHSVSKDLKPTESESTKKITPDFHFQTVADLMSTLNTSQTFGADIS